MALIKNDLGKRALGVQYKIVSSGSATAVDLGALSDDVEVFNIPGNAVITDAHVNVGAAFNGTGPTLDVKLTDLDGNLVVVLVAAAATGVGARTDAVIAASMTTAPTLVTVANSAADSLLGDATIEVEYYVVGRSNENEG